jgi:hypothetical protein
LALDKNWQQLILNRILIVVCLVAPALSLLLCNCLENTSDFPNYYVAGKLIAGGKFAAAYDLTQTEIFQHQICPEMGKRFVPFFIAFPLAWIFAVLAIWPFKTAFLIWNILLCLCLVAAFFIFSNIWHLSERKKLWVALVFGSSGPVLESIRIGQMSPILLLALALFSYGWVKKQTLIMSLGQSLFLFKPHLLLPIIFFELGARYFRVIGITCLVGAIGTFVAILLGGKEIIEAYFQLMTSRDVLTLYEDAGPTLSEQVIKLFPNISISVIAYVMYVLMLIMVFFMPLIFKNKNLLMPIFFSVCFPLIICFSPHFHNYGLILLFPAILAPFVYTTYSRAWQLQAVSFTLIVMLYLPVYGFLHYYHVLRGGINLFGFAIFIFAITAFLSLKSNDKIEEL